MIYVYIALAVAAMVVLLVGAILMASGAGHALLSGGESGPAADQPIRTRR